MLKNKLLLCLAICAVSVSMAAQAEQKITVFAAASLTNAIQEIAAEYEKEKAVSIQTSFAASSTLAKQIEQGAPADIFMSADTRWMGYLQERGLIDPGSRTNLLGNQLVLIAPRGKAFKVEMDRKFNFGAAFSGRLCTGETESVPIGIYAKQALKNLAWWDAIKMRLVGTQDVRAALVFVERGECAAGIVYETDARVSAKVETVATFPEASHDPVIYPLALVKGASPQAAAFYHYMKGDKAKAVFTRYGFNRFC
ncbi:molybdate ABC transporter substrate-binding protein [Methylotenera sp. G11]|uniref:molybdate ABC transporter substrate-binding protein n=1 Tax=Methylotenera sp. G11 TaxID=1506585 RepID=UPI000645774A|nr:molybdate ABC transporter substrate-binding protein [Methylotenera sp. G11]